MKRFTTQPRSSWQQIVSGQGLPYHTPEGKTYWDESVYYSFSLSEVELIEVATNELYEMYLNAAQVVIDQKRYAELAIPERAIPFIEAAWEESPPSIYGRFDLVFDEFGSVKLLEFNADTPTALVEAAVVQWY
jgi:glutathionylspermidine synthase